MGGNESVAANNAGGQIMKSENSQVQIDPKTFAFVKIDNDQRFGEIRIYQRIDNGDLIFQSTKNFNNEQQFETKLKQCAMRCKLSHYNLLQLFNFSHSKCEQFCSSFWKLTVVSEYYSKDLTQEIRERKNSNQEFTQGELWYLIDALVGALMYLRENGISHADVYPGSVFVTSQGELQLALNQMHNQHLFGYHQVVLGVRQELYLSPQLVQSLQSKNSYPEVNWGKVETYGLGLCVLEAATFEKIADIYDLGKYEVKQNILNTRIDSMKRKYSNELTDLLSQMLNPIQDSRASLQFINSEIESKYSKLVATKLQRTTLNNHSRVNRGYQGLDAHINGRTNESVITGDHPHSQKPIITKHEKDTMIVPEHVDNQGQRGGIAIIGALYSEPCREEFINQNKNRDPKNTNIEQNRDKSANQYASQLIDENGLIEGKYAIKQLVTPQVQLKNPKSGQSSNSKNPSKQTNGDTIQPTSSNGMQIDVTLQNQFINSNLGTTNTGSNSKNYAIQQDTAPQFVLPPNYSLAVDQTKFLNSLDDRINAVLQASKDTVSKYSSTVGQQPQVQKQQQPPQIQKTDYISNPPSNQKDEKTTCSQKKGTGLMFGDHGASKYRNGETAYTDNLTGLDNNYQIRDTRGFVTQYQKPSCLNENQDTQSNQYPFDTQFGKTDLTDYKPFGLNPSKSQKSLNQDDYQFNTNGFTSMKFTPLDSLPNTQQQTTSTLGKISNEIEKNKDAWDAKKFSINDYDNFSLTGTLGVKNDFNKTTTAQSDYQGPSQSFGNNIINGLPGNRQMTDYFGDSSSDKFQPSSKNFLNKTNQQTGLIKGNDNSENIAPYLSYKSPSAAGNSYGNNQLSLFAKDIPSTTKSGKDWKPTEFKYESKGILSQNFGSNFDLPKTGVSTNVSENKQFEKFGNFVSDIGLLTGVPPQGAGVTDSFGKDKFDFGTGAGNINTNYSLLNQGKTSEKYPGLSKQDRELLEKYTKEKKNYLL